MRATTSLRLRGVDAVLLCVALGIGALVVVAGRSRPVFAGVEPLSTATIAASGAFTGTSGSYGLLIERPVEGVGGVSLVSNGDATGLAPAVRLAVDAQAARASTEAVTIWPNARTGDHRQALLSVLTGGQAAAPGSAPSVGGAATEQPVVTVAPVSGWTWSLVLERVLGGALPLRSRLELTPDADVPDLIVPKTVPGPEPGSGVLLLIGGLLFAARRGGLRRRQRRPADAQPAATQTESPAPGGR